MTGGRRRAGGRWTELPGEGALGLDAGRGGPRAVAGPDGADAPGRGDAAGGGAGVGRASRAASA